VDAQLPNTDVKLPNTNVPEESKPSDPNQQLSNTELDGVVGGSKYLVVKMEDCMISSIEPTK